jgi:hypothetical protein
MVGRDPATGLRLVPACGVAVTYRPKLTSDMSAVTCAVCRDGLARKDPLLLARMRAALFTPHPDPLNALQEAHQGPVAQGDSEQDQRRLVGEDLDQRAVEEERGQLG